MTACRCSCTASEVQLPAPRTCTTSPQLLPVAKQLTPPAAQLPAPLRLLLPPLPPATSLPAAATVRLPAAVGEPGAAAAAILPRSQPCRWPERPLLVRLLGYGRGGGGGGVSAGKPSGGLCHMHGLGSPTVVT
jgi:hypothetical protein